MTTDILIIRETMSIRIGSQWKLVPRCSAVTKGGGAGYKGPHQCSFQAAMHYEDRPFCMTHIRQILRRNES